MGTRYQHWWLLQTQIRTRTFESGFPVSWINREENHSLCNRFVSSISLVFTRTSVWVSDGLMFWVRSIMRLIISVRGPASAYISLYPHDLSSLVTPSPAQPSHFLYVITDNDTALLMPGCSWWWLDGVDAHIMYAIMPRQHSQLCQVTCWMFAQQFAPSCQQRDQGTSGQQYVLLN